MNLSIALLADELSAFCPKTRSHDDLGLTFAGVRMYTPDAMAQMSDDLLVIASRQDLAENPSLARACTIICPDSPDHLDSIAPGWHGIALDSDVETAHVMMQCLRIFDDYNAWERRLLLAIARHASLQSILDVIATRFDNAIGLFDEMSVLIMKAGALPSDLEHSFWHDVLRDGFAHSERVTDGERRFYEGHAGKGGAPFILQPEHLNGEKMLVSVLWQGDKDVGVIASTDGSAPFSRGQISLFSFAADMMLIAMGASRPLAPASEGFHSSLMRLLDGSPVDEKVLGRQLQKLGLANGNSYHVFYCGNTDDEDLLNSTSNNLILRIDELIQPLFLAEWGGGVLALVQNDGSGSKRKIKDALEPLLVGFNAACGFSIDVPSPSLILSAAHQARLAIKLAGPEDGVFGEFIDGYRSRLASFLESKGTPSLFCDPSIAALERADLASIDSIDTLCAYLLSGCNASVASRRLRIHRNTLVYRIERIEGIIGLRFSQADADTVVCALISCLIVQSRRRH